MIDSAFSKRWPRDGEEEEEKIDTCRSFSKTYYHHLTSEAQSIPYVEFVGDKSQIQPLLKDSILKRLIDQSISNFTIQC